jgi:hypothetical protein
MKFQIHRTENGSIQIGRPKGAPLEAPQEVKEWMLLLEEEDLIPMASMAFRYAIDLLDAPRWVVLIGIVDQIYREAAKADSISLSDMPFYSEVLRQGLRSNIEGVAVRLGREPIDVAAEVLALMTPDDSGDLEDRCASGHTI